MRDADQEIHDACDLDKTTRENNLNAKKADRDQAWNDYESLSASAEAKQTQVNNADMAKSDCESTIALSTTTTTQGTTTTTVTTTQACSNLDQLTTTLNNLLQELDDLLVQKQAKNTLWFSLDDEITVLQQEFDGISCSLQIELLHDADQELSQAIQDYDEVNPQVPTVSAMADHLQSMYNTNKTAYINKLEELRQVNGRLGDRRLRARRLFLKHKMN